MKIMWLDDNLIIFKRNNFQEDSSWLLSSNTQTQAESIGKDGTSERLLMDLTFILRRDFSAQ